MGTPYRGGVGARKIVQVLTRGPRAVLAHRDKLLDLGELAHGLGKSGAVFRKACPRARPEGPCPNEKPKPDDDWSAGFCGRRLRTAAPGGQLLSPRTSRGVTPYWRRKHRLK